MNLNEKAHFVIKDKEVKHPSVTSEGLLAWYDTKGKKNSDLYKDDLIDMSGSGLHAQLHNFAYEKKSGYLETPEGGLLFDDVDDKLVYPSVKDEVEYTSASRNLLPPFSSGLWTLSGGATISGNTLTIPREGAFATIYMPWDRSDTKIRVSALYSAPPLINIRYLDDGGNEIGRNGWSSASVVPTERAYGALPYSESQDDLTKTKTIRVQLTTSSTITTTFPYTVTDMMLTANSHGNIPYTPYVPLPVMTYQYNGNILSYEADGTVKRVDDGKVITRKGINLLRNGNFADGSKAFSSSVNVEYTKYMDGELTVKPAIYNGSYGVFQTIHSTGVKLVQFSVFSPNGIKQVVIGTGVQAVTLEGGVWHKVYKLVESSGTTRFYAQPANDGDYYKIKNLSVINLTEAYGAGNEPTLEYIQAHPEEFAWTPNPNDLIETQEIKNNLVGDLEDLHGTGDKTEILSGVGEVFTDKADDDSIVHVELEGKSVQPHRFREESGESLVLTNHAEDKPRKLVVLGNTFQNISTENPNLMTSTKFEEGFSTDWSGTVPAIILDEKFGRVAKINTRSTTGMYQPANYMTIGSVYTVSVYAKSNVENFTFYVAIDGNGAQNAQSFQIGTTWQRITATFTNTTTNKNVRFYGSGEFYIAQPKMEEGADATVTSPSPDYPSEMKSVGEGLELVSGIGKRNLAEYGKWLNWNGNMTASGSSILISNNTDGGYMGIRQSAENLKIKTNTQYVFTFDIRKMSGNLNNIGGHASPIFNLGELYIDNVLNSTYVTPADNMPVLNDGAWHRIEARFTSTNIFGSTASFYIQPNRRGYAKAEVEIKNIKMEESISSTPWVPAPEDVPLNTTQSGVFRTKPNLTAPLRKVGDVADRLFWDATAGKWKVERRVGEQILNGSEDWRFQSADNGCFISILDKSSGINMMSSSHFMYDNTTRITGYFRETTSNKNVIFYFDEGANGTIPLRGWLSENPVTIQYKLETPTIETLEGGQLPPLFSPTTYLDTISEVKGQLTAGYRLKEGVTPEASDILVSPEYVNPVHSVDKVDVVSSVGRRNLINKVETISTRIATDIYFDSKMLVGKTYVLSFDFEFPEHVKSPERFRMFDLSSKIVTNTNLSTAGALKVSSGRKGSAYAYFTLISEYTGNSTAYGNPLRMRIHHGTHSGGYVEATLSNLKLEEGSFPTAWVPHEEHIQSDTYTPTLYKTNILLSEPLRSVGDVRDRLFRDSDGLWKVERKTAVHEFDGTENMIRYLLSGTYPDVVGFYTRPKSGEPKGLSGGYASSHFATYEDTSFPGVLGSNREEFQVSRDNYIKLSIYKNRLQSYDANGIKVWMRNKSISGEPVSVFYELASPTIETLPQSDQDKLNNIATYAESNYVYTVLPDKDTELAEQLHPTIHAKFRKLSWFWSRLLFNQLKIWKRNLTDSELLHEWKQNKKRWGM